MAVVTELTIDGTGATRGAQEYERAMDRAQQSMHRGMGAMSTDLRGANDNVRGLANGITSLLPSIGQLQIAAVAVGAAILAGVVAVAAQIEKYNKNIIDMEANARRAGLTLTQFNRLQTAGTASGLDKEKFAAGAEAMATRLNDAKRNENDLSKLLDANNVRFKEGNRILVDNNRMFEIARDLIRRGANEWDKIKIAEMLGLTREWVPVLDKSRQEFEKIQNGASALGIVITSETIDLAKKFEKEWKQAGDVFSTWIKASVEGLLPVMDQLIDKAKKFSDALNKPGTGGGAADPASRSRLEVLSDMMGRANSLTEVGVLLKAFLVEMRGETSATTKALLDQEASVLALSKAWEQFGKGGAMATAMAVMGAGGTKTSGTKFGSAWLAGIQSAFPNLTSVVPAGPSTNVPGDDTSNRRDQWERAIDQIDKHISRIKADSLAVGQSVGVHEQLRTEFGLLEAARLAEKGVTDEQIEAYTRLRGSMAAAAALTQAQIGLSGEDRAAFLKRAEGINAVTTALERVKINSQINFDRKTMFLSEQDVQIATKLRGLYGDDIPAALASSEAAGLRLNMIMKQTRDYAASFANTLVQGLIDGKGLAESLKASLKNVGQSVTTAGINNIIKDPTSPTGYIEAGVGLVMQWLGKDNGLKQAKENWEGMSDQVRDFNEAARGVDLQPLTQSLRQARDTEEQLWLAAQKAKDSAGMAAIVQNYVDIVRRTLDEFSNGTPVLDEFGTKLKAAIDTAAQLTEEAARYGAVGIAEAQTKTAAGLKRIAEQIGTDFTLDLQSKINEALGQGYLNEIGGLITDRQKQLANIDALRGQGVNVDPALIDRYFAVQAQKIIDDANLVGTAFDDMIAAFPQLAGVVHESNKAIEEQIEEQKRLADQQNAAARSILDYVNGLLAGPQSGLSPANRLAAAQSTYATQLPLAQAGNIDALGRITQDFENVRTAAQAMFGSSAAYQAILQQGLSELIGLPAVQGSDDPVVVALRDTLGPLLEDIKNNTLNTVTAVGDLNFDFDGNGIIDAVEAMNRDLSLAFASGSASAIAGELSTYFDQLNTTVDDGLTLEELQQGIANLATNQGLYNVEGQTNLVREALVNSGGVRDWIASVFQELDGNGNGILEKEELIKAAALDTKNNTAATTSALAAANVLSDAIKLATEGMKQWGTAGVLDSIQSLQSTSREQLQILNSQLAGSQGFVASVPTSAGAGGVISVGSVTVNNTMLQALNKIVYNTAIIAANTKQLAPNGTAFGAMREGTFALGGTNPAGQLAIFGEHHPQGPWALRANEPVTFSPGFPTANDNSAMAAELRAVRQELADIKRELRFNTAVTNDGNAINRVGHAMTAGKVDEQTGTIKSEARQDRANPQRRSA